MKKFTVSIIVSIFLLTGISINSTGQTSFWSEDFSSYVNNTGIEGPGVVNIGDYPANVTKWTLDVSDCTLSDNNDYFKTYYGKLKGRDIDGCAVWQSESIDISSFSSVFFSLNASEGNPKTASDYFDVLYQVDGGSFILIPNWDNMGNDFHTLIDDFPATTISQTISSGNQLVIKVEMKNDGSYSDHIIDNVFVEGYMGYASSTTVQNINKIAPNRTNENIIAIEIETTGSESPFSISSFTVNANGSTTPLSNNIENAKIFYTGTDNYFEATNQFGSVYAVPTTTNFDITGTQELSAGTNYFWLTFDTKAGATIGDVVDAECISFVIDGTSKIPTITAPAGLRTIAAPLSGDYTIGATGDYSSFTNAVDELMALGISAPVTFTVSNGTYTEQILLSEIAGTSATDTIIFQSGSGNRADVILQYEPTSDPANHILKFNGTDYITFQNMTLKNTGSSAYGRVVVFTGATNNINLTGCNITGRDINNESFDYIVIKGESGITNMASNIVFDNDTIRYGSRGLYFSGGDNDNLETGNKISNSVFEDFYSDGILLYYQDSIVVHRNKITSKGIYDYEYGIYLGYCYGSNEITANMVFLSAEDVNCGIKLYECHASAARYALIANNYFSQVSTGGAYGIDVSDCSYQKIYHNSINMRSSAKSGKSGKFYPTVGCYFDCMNSPGYGFIALLNNIVKSAEKAISVSQSAVNNGYLENSDNNVWYGTGPGFGDWGDTPCTTIDEWQTASLLDINSDWDDPEYVSSEVPDITNETLEESVTRLSEVLRDIHNSRRAGNTTPGATIFDNLWTGNYNHDWHEPSNWSLGVVPDENHNVIINDGDYDNAPMLFEDANCNLLTMFGENTLLQLGGNQLNIYGNIDLTPGYSMGSSNAMIADGTLNFMGAGAQTTYIDIHDNPEVFNNVDLTFDNNSNTTTTTDLDVKSITTNTGSELNLDDHDCKISDDIDLSPSTLTDPGKVTFSGTANSQVTTGGNVLEDVIIGKDGATVELMDDLVAKNVEIEMGILDAKGNKIKLIGDADFSGGPLNNPGEIVFEGTGNSEITAGGNILDKVVVDKDDPLFEVLAKEAFIAGALEILKGKMKAEQDIEITGKVTVGNSGTGAGELEISKGKSVIVVDTITIEKTGKVKLKADSIVISKLIPKKKIVKKPGGIFIAERKYRGGEWHLVSSPISDATADIFGDDQLQYHTEADNSRIDIDLPSYPLEIMQGYFLMSTTTGYDSIDFNGTPNSGEQSFDFTYAGSAPVGDYGWNLVGNPYTATLDWDAVTIPDNLDGTIYFFDPSIGDNGDYVYYLKGAGSNTATQYVALAQGFFVHCSNTAGGTLTFTGDEMVAIDAPFYKSTEQAENSLILEVAGHESSKAEIRFLEGATPGFDGNYDVYRLFSESKDVPVIYSATDWGKLAINTLPSIENHDLVIVGFKVGMVGNYTIGFSGIDNFDPSIPIYLHDTKENITVDIRQNNQYSFYYDTLDVSDRFVLCFTENTTTTQTVSLAEGWSGWSSYNSPDWKSSMEEVMAPVLDDMIITQYFSEIYYPLYGINTMGSFSNAHGYISKMSAAADLPNTGIIANPTIELNQGWNLIPLISQCDVDVTLLGALPGFIIACEIAGGGIYYPKYGINTINLMVPGAAYYVKVDANTNFTFPVCADASIASTHKPLRFENNTPWDNIHYTGVSHSVVFEENATFLLQQGDVIGAFTHSGLCTGIVNIVPGTVAGLNIFGDDITTNAVDGHTDGEPLNFKLFRTSCATEFELDMVYDPSSPNADGLFSVNGMSVISNLTMNASEVTAHSLSKLNIYPNPSKGIFNIAGISLNQDIELVVFNTHGQVVYEEKSIKSHEIDLSHQARGVYFIQFINSTALKIEKVLVE